MIESGNKLTEPLFEFEKGKFWVLIFKQSTIDNNSWADIQAKNLYDKKYAFTLKELEVINYTIVYDGN